MRAVLVRCGERPLALPAEAVSLVAPASAAMPLPRMPPWVEGAAAYGREVMPQIALGALLGLAGHGGLAVIVRGSAGPLALRVTAAERVIEGQAVTGRAADDLVAGSFRHREGEVSLLAPERLLVPVPAPMPLGLAPTEGRDRALPPPTMPAREEPADLLCRAGGRRLRFPRDAVLSMSTALPGVPLLDLAPMRPEGSAPAVALTIRTAAGPRLAGVDEILGFGRDPAARTVDAAVLEAAPPPPPSPPKPLPVRRQALLLMTASGRQVLVPRAKATRVGRSHGSCELPPSGTGAARLVALGGDLLPALDVGRLLGQPEAQRSLAVAVECRGRSWALACDGVTERHAAIVGRPATVAGLPCLGEAEVAEGLLPVLDLDRLAMPEARP